MFKTLNCLTAYLIVTIYKFRKSQFDLQDHFSIIKKLECLQISKFLRFKMIWSSSIEKIILGVKFCTRNLDRSKKRRHWEKGIEGEWLAASSWGDVQLYRRPLGLIYVAECKNPMDVALLVENYIEMRKKLGSAVFDSRCLIFGVSTELLDRVRKMAQ